MWPVYEEQAFGTTRFAWCRIQRQYFDVVSAHLVLLQTVELAALA